MVRYMVCLDSSEDAPKKDNRFIFFLIQIGRGNGHEQHVVLVGVAEIYQRNNILNILRVDFDTQILDKANKSIVKGTREVLEDFRGELARRGVSVSVVVEAGDPREKLCEVAERERPDLMMIGHHTTGLDYLPQLGSVAVHCIEHAPASIFIVRV